MRAAMNRWPRAPYCRPASLGLVGLMALLSGCLPLPHYQHDYPELSGVVRSGSVPLSGAKVTLQHNGPEESCPNPDQTVTTDLAGRFAFEASEVFQFLMVFGDRKDRWTVCVERDDGAEVAWSGDGYWGGPERQSLVCDIEANGATPVMSCHPR